MIRDLTALYLSPALLSCFDGEGDGTGDGGAPAGGDGGAPAGGDGGKKTPKLFTQDDVDKLMMGHRKGLQKTVDELKAQLADSKGQDSEALRQKIEEMSLSLKTKDEQAASEKKRLLEENDKKYKTAEERANKAEQTLRDYQVQHSLQSAAIVGEAFNPAQIIVQLKDKALVNEEGQVKIKGLFTTEDGQPSLQDPTEAIKWMREHPEEYGNLFKSNVVGGIGGSSSPAGMPPKGGKIDMRKLTPEQYQKMRKENPSALGFDS